MLTNDLLRPLQLERALGGTRRQPGLLVELLPVERKDADVDISLVREVHTPDDARIRIMAPVGAKLAAPTLDRNAA